MENNEAVNDTLSMAADIISDTELGLADLETMVKVSMSGIVNIMLYTSVK